MKIYVLQIKPGYEEAAARILRCRGFTAMCPTVEVLIRHGGTWHKQLKLVFTHYIFVECELTDDAYYRIKSVCGVVRFLGFGKPEPLRLDEAEHIRLMYNGGKTIEASKVYVTGAGEKMVLSGILRDYADKIIHLDLRQRRAKVRATLLGKPHTITLPVISI